MSHSNRRAKERRSSENLKTTQPFQVVKRVLKSLFVDGARELESSAGADILRTVIGHLISDEIEFAYAIQREPFLEACSQHVDRTHLAQNYSRLSLATDD